jgi:hypothetical protein
VQANHVLAPTGRLPTTTRTLPVQLAVAEDMWVHCRTFTLGMCRAQTTDVQRAAQICGCAV